MPINPGVTGTDGEVPIWNPEGRWDQFRMNQVYFGAAGLRKYVPNVGDYVEDTELFETYIVVSIDPTTKVPTLKKINRNIPDQTFEDEDRLIGPNAGPHLYTFRCYIDQSVIPHVLAVDHRLVVRGSMCAYAIIYKGSVADGSAYPVSIMYDSNNTPLGERIPLELVEMNDSTNVATKCVMTCYTREKLQDGEVLTIVFYETEGHVVSKCQLLVENTAFIRSSDMSIRYITHISLESQFLSDSNPNQIDLPINVNVSGMNLFGVVHYNDNSTKRLAVDGRQFSTLGLNDLVSTIVGQERPFLLKYKLAPDEVVYGATVTTDKFITEQYNVLSTNMDGTYTVKLFGYPVWIDSTNGYRMEWWLLNLDRNILYYATPYVIFNDNTLPAYNPTLYGPVQMLSVSIDINKVNGAYKKFKHTQVTNVLLAHEATDHSTYLWTTGDVGQNPPYGIDNFAKMEFINSNLKKLKLGMGCATKEEWLERLYYRTNPLFDSYREAAPVLPDMFSIITPEGNEVEFPISQWNDELIINLIEVVNNSTLFIKFFKRTIETDLILSIAGVPVDQTN